MDASVKCASALSMTSTSWVRISADRRRRADYIGQQLQELYPNPDIPLDHSDPYTLLVAVLLSAQCTDKRVNQITPKLFALADHPEAMAQQPVEAVLDIVRPCGLGPFKAKSIVELSQQLVTEHNSVVPKDQMALEKLPGVGHKTASVVMCQAFGIPTFPVDTHIHRLAMRWRLSSGKNVTETERHLKKLYDSNIWHDLHIQMILYGRHYCTARQCDGTKCPMCQVVQAGNY